MQEIYVVHLARFEASSPNEFRADKVDLTTCLYSASHSKPEKNYFLVGKKPLLQLKTTAVICDKQLMLSEMM
jgi:hypothetical protein